MGKEKTREEMINAAVENITEALSGDHRRLGTEPVTGRGI